ncbi:TRAP transporter small permease [Salinisphaera sp. LB1]|uniref:TRAP transporter small permease n=1 Tax=Salinisphaera sp. LB1 TaxID=2183911 RepID=UPI000D706E2F|nr:TRAP transporter small permease subunit [Salinisphaera sp. LB1]AWN15380.1 TRAP-type C4-dicarboxylate transport system, small permease component [Salinisphaera sp. LB1]
MIEQFVCIFESGIGYLRTGLAIVVGCLVLAVFFCVSANVFGRYVLNSSYDWAAEMSRFFFIWAVLLGAGVACLRRQNIAVAILKDAVPGGVAAVFELIKIAIVYMICVIIVFAYLQLISGYVSSTPLLGIPMTYLYIAMVVFAAFMFLANTADLLRLLARATRSA